MSGSFDMDADEGVQSTNDDAQECKASCVQAGYFKDDFVQCFVRKKGAPLRVCSSSSTARTGASALQRAAAVARRNTPTHGKQAAKGRFCATHLWHRPCAHISR